MHSGSPERTAVIVDEHPLWLESVELAVGRANIAVVARATAPSDALARVEALEPDLVVTGLKTPDGEIDGVEFVRRVRERAPAAKVVVLSMFDDAEHIDAALNAGAHAYVLKTTHPDDLIAAIRQAFNHSIYLASARTPVANGGADGGDSHGLTRRELEILKLVAEGHSNAQVARLLWVTEQTVKFHLSNVYRKLGVANRTEASRFAQVRGLLTQAERKASLATA
ncbi:MAG TPA: response regulator transcription factor [Gaiellaceae bacterium]|nr:response regulator transcription factor [Gaiellaceae bacterium]